MSIFRKITLYLLTLLMLVSSTGLSVGIHVCGGSVVGFGLNGEAPGCPMEEISDLLPSCHKTNENLAAENVCCKDKFYKLEKLEEGQPEKAVAITQTDLGEFTILVSGYQVYLVLPEINFISTRTFYTPPDLPRDIPVLVQSFLI